MMRIMSISLPVVFRDRDFLPPQVGRRSSRFIDVEDASRSMAMQPPARRALPDSGELPASRE
jgi:hypothetical protein